VSLKAPSISDSCNVNNGASFKTALFNIFSSISAIFFYDDDRNIRKYENIKPLIPSLLYYSIFLSFSSFFFLILSYLSNSILSFSNLLSSLSFIILS